MPLSKEDVRGIADYARIALTDAELEEMTAYMNDAVAMLEPIRQLDTEGVEPTYHPIGDLSNVMSDDVVDDSVRALPLDVALQNASSSEGRFFRVPSILGDEGGDF
ncbi:MAG: Asp-tRNA(Asn)/Glu-tRNA(Gln) amidotransferase subunit GatC [Atopobiaceae bacterium]|jgi:aspartyl-tRNA(Asn)/glutamyl-tRNA(Gln) amidotransferase subunit C|nr:Asp-tRNA(Asn)/Glu-tRNA(Gln) amidotransferase subunit GatC [Atopobiaceae bacterium]MCH4119946.1 Asp-tRNA(Asn)/Glu-tRNA(Gln) amidotransferase subunit GatC [Atopobiaceae bacterium]MCI1389306.1 Asp-tRNA(Asn)/Glu-tRNA(Gln) amidotransferase subunit GatC [Atopobiaceae bacterium]MCI1432369.1 Asp-tRNA(Asn)/Glu-tRNA(Gln) amidotransferase subunit GatC [Atopobiaceae bacterium]MCI1470827.1 Asp-tRNA(Asn)/Glu-tRNA(Gln) amidotransferase subunit GatC [Atopobiaceae bacterium]